MLYFFTNGINIENQGIFPLKIKEVILKDYNGINIEEIYIVKYDTTKVSTGKVVLGEFKFNNYIKKVYNRNVKTTQKKFSSPRSIKIIYMYLGKKFVVEFTFRI